MTAPGREPDEVTTPRSEEPADPPGSNADTEPDLKAIGDNHMPEDVREAVREEHEPPEEPTSAQD